MKAELIISEKFPNSTHEIQISTFKYKGLTIYERDVVFYHWGTKSKYSITIDLNLPINTPILNGSIESVYHEKGFGSPVFSNWEDLYIFADEFLKPTL